MQDADIGSPELAIKIGSALADAVKRSPGPRNPVCDVSIAMTEVRQPVFPKSVIVPRQPRESSSESCLSLFGP